jgi:enoyl-CoA hydratase/carnithine racemase
MAIIWKANPEPAQARLRQPGHLYDMRAGKYLGYTDHFSLTYSCAVPQLFGVLPYRVKAVTVTGPLTPVARGTTPTFTMRVTGEGQPVGHHVLHVTVLGPDGSERRAYTANQEAPAGKATFSLPLALNDLPGRWTVTFSNPPINMFLPTTIVELGALMTDLEADPSVKVVVFQSANPDFFIAHLDVAKAAERPEALGLWRDFVLRLSSTPVVSIAKIRGRTRGIGNEFVLACDMRFASRQSALFGNPEIGVGLVPGGGALEWLPRLVGRSRALEIVLSGDDFDADIAERYGWVNRTLDDDDLDSFVDKLVRRLASFDREALAAAKAQVNRFGTPTATELQSSNDLFFPLLALPGAQARRARIRNIGYGVRSDFELNFGRYLPAFGRANDDQTDTAKVGL